MIRALSDRTRSVHYLALRTTRTPPLQANKSVWHAICKGVVSDPSGTD